MYNSVPTKPVEEVGKSADPSPKQVTLRFLEEDSVAEISAIHRSAFPESAWTKLGGSIVEEYYRWHLLGPHPIVRATGAFVEGRCAGFCVSGVFHASTSGFISNNRKLLIARLALRPWLLTDPVFIEKLRSGLKILKRFKAKKRKTASNPPEKAVDSFGILAIAVDPSRQGLGIGHVLMADAEKGAVEDNFSKMDLTVNPKNHGAIKFYEKLGWVRFKQNKLWTGTMLKNIQTAREL